MSEINTPEQQQVIVAFERWIEAVTTTDPETVAALYADDAVLWGTLSPYLRITPEQVRHYFEHFMQLANLTAIYHHPQVRVYGDVAVNSGYYTFFHERDGKMQSLPARYTFVYRRVGAEWKIIDHHSSAVPTNHY
jgi:uncharacterized protein (TIGR02246 family)